MELKYSDKVTSKTYKQPLIEPYGIEIRGNGGGNSFLPRL